MKKKHILAITSFLLMILACKRAPQTNGNTALEQPGAVPALVEELYSIDTTIPIPPLNEAEKNFGVIFDNEMKGGWQLVDSNNQPTYFTMTDAVLFVVYCDPRYNDGPGIPYIKDKATYFAVLYYKAQQAGVWRTEYAYGYRKGSLIEIDPSLGKNTKGLPYTIRHIIDDDGRRYLKIEGHGEFPFKDRMFIKTMP